MMEAGDNNRTPSNAEVVGVKHKARWVIRPVAEGALCWAREAGGTGKPGEAAEQGEARQGKAKQHLAEQGEAKQGAKRGEAKRSNGRSKAIAARRSKAKRQLAKRCFFLFF
jgi:hypothetical protein